MTKNCKTIKLDVKEIDELICFIELVDPKTIQNVTAEHVWAVRQKLIDVLGMHPVDRMKAQEKTMEEIKDSSVH